MKTYQLSKVTPAAYERLLKRPAVSNGSSNVTVNRILTDIKKSGLKEAMKYARRFGEINDNEIKVTQKEISESGKNLSPQLKKAIKTAYRNIYAFHLKQKPCGYAVATMPGVLCKRDFRPIESVGLYIPGGSAVLFSSLLMLAIPAKIAGCKRIAVFSPAKENVISDELLYTAGVCGIKEFYKIGGVQAIGLMAYGDKNIPKVDKIFGPGNKYVTLAKSIVSIDPEGCAIDMPAGPSEVLVIADKFADPAFVAADMLSQAEHGSDSQAVLITIGNKTGGKVIKELETQAEKLDRKKEIKNSLKSSLILQAENIEEALKFSNRYAPEHLILNLRDADKYLKDVSNAGSVFTGEYSPESAGDYASGANHSLPTYGYARSYSGVTVEQFMKSITFQKLTYKGLKTISECVITMAEAEKLQAHAAAVKVRLKK